MADAIDVAVVELQSDGQLARNLGRVQARVSAAAAAGAKLILLPENFAFFGKDTERRTHAEALGDLNAPIQSLLSELARSLRVNLIAGGFPTHSADPERPYNTCAAFDDQGALRASYHKIHLFDVDLEDGTTLRESLGTARGAEPVVVELAGFRCGLSICYDLRFPELYRRLVDLGAEILVVPAAFTVTTGAAHWHVLLRARAIESQAWLMAAAQRGSHPHGRTTYGHSLIVDPWGRVLSEVTPAQGIASATLRRSTLETIRDQLPSLRHRRLGTSH